MMKTHSISKFSSIFTYLEIIQNFFVSSLCWGVIYKENTRLFDAMSYEYHEYYFSSWTNWIVTNIFHETIFLTQFPKHIYLIENSTLYPHDIKRSSMNLFHSGDSDEFTYLTKVCRLSTLNKLYSLVEFLVVDVSKNVFYCLIFQIWEDINLLPLW